MITATALAPGLRFVEPSHQLLISQGTAGKKLGSCRCGRWSHQATTSDYVSAMYLDHLAAEGAVSPTACDMCQSGVAAIREGCTELCGRCAVDQGAKRDAADELAHVA